MRQQHPFCPRVGFHHQLWLSAVLVCEVTGFQMGSSVRVCIFSHLKGQPFQQKVGLLKQCCGQREILPSAGWAASGFSLHYLPCKLDSRRERGFQIFEMLYAKTLYISLAFLFFYFNIKQPFSLPVLCLRTEEQHLLETKEREWQQGVSTKRPEADTENHLLLLTLLSRAQTKCCSS